MSSPSRTAEIAATLAKLASLMAEDDAEHGPTPDRQQQPRPMPERVLLTVEEAARELRIGRTKAYDLVKTGELESIHIGRLRRVPKDAINDYAARLTTQQHAA